MNFPHKINLFINFNLNNYSLLKERKMKLFSLNFTKRLTITNKLSSLGSVISPNSFFKSLPLKTFSTGENLNDVNFAFHTTTKPKLRIKSTPQISPLNFMAQRDVPFFVIKESSIKKRDKRFKPTIISPEFQYSSYKLNDVCKLIRGKYIRTALEILDDNNTKGAKLIKKELSEYLERRDKQTTKDQERLIQQKKIREREVENNLKMDKEDSLNQEDEHSTQYGDKIMIENSSNEEENVKFDHENNSEFETEIIEKKSEESDYLPYQDYKIVEAYVGRKVGPGVPSPRAKGKVDRIFRSLSKLYVHIEKVSAEKYFENVATGRADISFAKNFRKLLFMNNAPLKTIKAFSFITTARGRYYRKTQFDRLVIFLRDKYYKEKGIKLNTEIIRDQLKKQLGKEMAYVNPNNLNYLLSNNKDNVAMKINERIYNRLRVTGTDAGETAEAGEQIKDKSYRAREEEFNKNYRKIE